MITSKHFFSNCDRSDKGQALILVAVAFVVLLAFVGLASDVGMLFISMGTLRRSVDAAALAAAAQYRESRTVDEMAAAAVQVISVNGIDPDLFTVTVQTCDTTPGDPALCTTPRRKLVRVIGNYRSPTTFLRLIGFNDIAINADSISEAASLDVVLVIDLSESMTWDADPDDYLRDPHACNDEGGGDDLPGECHPFEEVKAAARNFALSILNKPEGIEEDRLQIVTFANGWSSELDMGTHYRFVAGGSPRWTSNVSEAIDEIENLRVFDPPRCYADDGSVRQYYGPCRLYDELGEYQYLDCLSCWDSGDWSALPTTNIGGGLLRAGNMFAVDTREDALWVVVVLTDGMANATDLDEGDAINVFSSYPIGFCPDAQDTPFPVFPLCQDENVLTHHESGDAAYDADDYAKDMADFVGCYPDNPADACDGTEGQGAIIFAIGLGDGVLDDGCDRGECEAGERPYGATLLRYIAAVGYDGDSSRDPCDSVPDYTDWCGNYYFAPEGPQLSRIFEDIASRIFTRLTH